MCTKNQVEWKFEIYFKQTSLYQLSSKKRFQYAWRFNNNVVFKNTPQIYTITNKIELLKY